MREYSTLVKMTVEARSPFRQARMFFLYPATIAGASVAFYVALTRVIAAVRGARVYVTRRDDPDGQAPDWYVLKCDV